MAAAQKSPEDVISAINVTPFVDVVLVLLIILMVTSTEIARRSVQVDLPSAATAGASVPRTLNVVIDETGAVLMDGEPVTMPELRAHIRGAVSEDPKVRAVISADQRVPYRSVVRIIDVVRQSGVHKFALDVVSETAS